MTLVLLAVMPCSARSSVKVRYNGETARLSADHPRLILTDARLDELKTACKTDTLLQRYVNDVLTTVEKKYMGLPVLERIIVTRDMLKVSREELMRVYYLSFAYRWTGDVRYAEEAQRHLLAVCDFIDWDPHHFLDTAEMTHAVAIGYDWLYGWLDAGTKEILRNAIIEKGCKEGLKVYASEGGFDKRVNNWNQVCNNSMIIGALAVGDTDPVYLKKILPLALDSLPLAMPAFDPDGVCVEGPSYWHYAVRYCAYGCSAMMTALGTDFNVSGAYEGFRKTGYFPITMTGPANYMLAFSDCHMKVERSYLPPMFWLATRFSNPDFSESEHKLLESRPAQVFHVMYYTPRIEGWASSSALDQYMDSKVEVACMRSGWNNEALFVGLKGGTTNVSHVHLDMGNFEIDALGERWVLDLGSDSYNMPGYFDFKKQRWDYYRNITSSHNLPLFNGRQQCLDTKVRFSKVVHNVESPYVSINLQNAYRDECSAMDRGIRLVRGRNAVLVQDEYQMIAGGNVKWGFMTDAEIRTEGNQAILTIGDKLMAVTILCPSNASFSVESAHQDPPQNPNDGVNRLVINLDGQKNGTISVLFSPVTNGDYVKEYAVTPIKDWE